MSFSFGRGEGGLMCWGVMGLEAVLVFFSFALEDGCV